MKSFPSRWLPLVGLLALVMLVAPSRGQDEKKPAAKVEVRKTEAKDKDKKKDAAPADKGKSKVEEPLPPLRDELEFVFLGEARPVLVRLRVVVDGKTPTAAWHDFMQYLFADLDVNKDGVLNKTEAERLLNGEQLTLGGIGLLAGGSGQKALEALDANKDGKVTLDELKLYYRKNKFTPFQFQLNLRAGPAGRVELPGHSRRTGHRLREQVHLRPARYQQGRQDHQGKTGSGAGGPPGAR